MSAVDITGVLVLAYATVACVWTLLLDLKPIVLEPKRERPSALPAMRELPR
jgi:hypothetical protein